MPTMLPPFPVGQSEKMQTVFAMTRLDLSYELRVVSSELEVEGLELRYLRVEFADL